MVTTNNNIDYINDKDKWWNDLPNDWKEFFIFTYYDIYQKYRLSYKFYDFLFNLEHIKLPSSKTVISLEPLRYFNNLLSIDLNQTNINSLKGLENCKNLIKVDISFTSINSLYSIRQNINLSYIDISYTRITSLRELSYFYKLKTIVMKGLYFDSIFALKSLYNLENLYIDNKNLIPNKDLIFFNTVKFY